MGLSGSPPEVLGVTCQVFSSASTPLAFLLFRALRTYDLSVVIVKGYGPHLL